MIKVSEINVYPIKSLGQISKKQMLVEKQGFENDRLLMLVDSDDKFITQRKYPSLALISIEEINDKFLISLPNGKILTVSKSDLTEDKKEVIIWKDSCSVISAKQSVNQWFSEYLGFDVSLVAYDCFKPRKTDRSFSKKTDIVSFADGFPVLVISQASLDNLNNKLKHPVSMQRFRPNLVVEGCEAFAEDQWRNITIGDVEFNAVKICSRCVLTTIDPKTGIKDSGGEPLKTLSKYRKNVKGVKNEKGVFFGMNLIPKNKGIIRLGDSISID